MRIAAKTEYACIAVLELAARFGSGEPVRVRDIADLHGIPSRFLVQILLQLKAAGLVASTRGAAGGYQLIKPPEEITLADVMTVIEGAGEVPNSNVTVESPMSAALLRTWREVAAVQQDMLAAVTFADLVQQAGAPSENMYYI